MWPQYFLFKAHTHRKKNGKTRLVKELSHTWILILIFQWNYKVFSYYENNNTALANPWPRARLALLYVHGLNPSCILRGITKGNLGLGRVTRFRLSEPTGDKWRSRGVSRCKQAVLGASEPYGHCYPCTHWNYCWVSLPHTGWNPETKAWRVTAPRLPCSVCTLRHGVRSQAAVNGRRMRVWAIPLE